MSQLTDTELSGLNAWRRTVVRLWLVTMAAAFALWTAVTAFTLPQSIQLAFAGLLVALVLITLRTMRRGQCPRCGKRIRFAPRIEIPPACVHCNIDFRSAAVEHSRDEG